MIVRHKDHPTMTCSVCDEGKTFYIADPCNPDTERFLGRQNGSYALLKGVWEPIPEARWKNVTGDFEWNNTTVIGASGGWTSIKHRIIRCFGLPDGYRLISKKMCDLSQDPSKAFVPVDAFVIEKQE